MCMWPVCFLAITQPLAQKQRRQQTTDILATVLFFFHGLQGEAIKENHKLRKCTLPVFGLSFFYIFCSQNYYTFFFLATLLQFSYLRLLFIYWFSLVLQWLDFFHKPCVLTVVHVMSISFEFISEFFFYFFRLICKIWHINVV